jgi:hypothetical protein
MLKKLPENPQLVMFKTVLTSFIHPDHKLCLLAKEIDWASLEKEFESLYRTTGRPSLPISLLEDKCNIMVQILVQMKKPLS